MTNYLNKIIQGDCLEVMKGIPDKSINLIILDPPYNIGKDKRWDKWKTVSAYVEWMGKVFMECQRVLMDNGSFYFFHNDFLQIVELQSWLNVNSKFVFKQLIIWDKFNGSKWNQLNAIVYSNDNRNYSKQAEYLLYYTFQDETGSNEAAQKSVRDYLRDERDKAGYKNKDINIILDYPSNGGGYASHYFGECITRCSIPTKEHYNKLQQTGYFKKSYEELRQEYESLRYTFNNQGLPSVWLHEPMKQNGHVTPKPIELIENIIKHSSNKGDTVLDCFIGSGTTAIACINTNRFFIGIEQNENYCTIANKRIAEAREGLN